MATIVLAHGAWSAAWAWKKMRPLMRAAGHEFFSPTYTGLGERAHLAQPEIDLSTHIQDVLAVLEIEDLKDVTLIGHSYGGMVATGVADKARRPHRPRGLSRRLRPQGRPEPVRPASGRKGRGNMRGKARAKDGDGWKLAAPSHAARHRARGRQPGRRRAGARSRSRPSSRRSGCSRRPSRRRAITSTPRRADRATCSASSANAPRARRAGSTTRSTPAITRTSPARRS